MTINIIQYYEFDRSKQSKYHRDTKNGPKCWESKSLVLKVSRASGF